MLKDSLTLVRMGLFCNLTDDDRKRIAAQGAQVIQNIMVSDKLKKELADIILQTAISFALPGIGIIDNYYRVILDDTTPGRHEGTDIYLLCESHAVSELILVKAFDRALLSLKWPGLIRVPSMENTEQYKNTDVYTHPFLMRTTPGYKRLLSYLLDAEDHCSKPSIREFRLRYASDELRNTRFRDTEGP